MVATVLNKLGIQARLFSALVISPKFWYIFIGDAVLLILAHYLAYTLRFEFILQDHILHQYRSILPLMLGIKLPLFYVFGLYRGMWRYTSLNDIVTILFANICSSGLVILLILFGTHFIGFSRSVFLLDGLFSFGLIASHRMGIRYFYQHQGLGKKHEHLKTTTPHKRLLLVGSGDAADQVLRELEDNNRLPYRVVGIVDDDPQKIGMKQHGVPILGVIESIEEQARRVSAQEILITRVVINKKTMRSLVALCQRTKLPFKVLPTMGELIRGQVSIKNIREISYKDLLGREEVRLEQEKIGEYLTAKTVLITGAGGSIGSELCRQVLRFAPALIILFDASEENLYSVQMELRHEHEDVRTIAILGKVQDLRLLTSVFDRYRPNIVFHTAAYKHVPLVERNPWQAVNNNIFGTQLLMEAAILYGVERFVLVSTDKAVRPTNVMGASKRVTELLMHAYTASTWDGTLSPAWARIGNTIPMPTPSQDGVVRHGTRFMGVRFGNVLGSSGSVIPLFKRQIEKGGPVTVTHPDVTRYFMSAEEATQLILQSVSMGEGGEIFVLRMGEPVKIADMARELITLTGREPDSEIEIRYVGLRAGEKLYEELITEGEGIVETHHEKIMVLRGEESMSGQALQEHLELLATQARNLDSHAIKNTLKKIVPEYLPDYTIS
jgi:FlaA1/EpsC-like NDP-sugar epimerase